MLVAAVLAIDPLRDAFGDAVRGDTDDLREDLRGLGAAGVAILYALIAIHTFVWYPAEIVDAAAGFVYGFWPAFAMVMTGWVAQGLAAYAIGRNAARPLLYRLIGEARFAGLERAIENGGVTLLLAARLVPIVPFSLFSYVAGAARVPVGRFAWTTAVGYIPITGALDLPRKPARGALADRPAALARGAAAAAPPGPDPDAAAAARPLRAERSRGRS